LLRRLNIPFQALIPDIDESALRGESVVDQVKRLALAKAQAIAGSELDALIIGSDQMASCNNDILGKPGSHAAATTQLQQMRGQVLLFHTGLCLLNSKTNIERIECVEYRVHFRQYSDDEIERYLHAEQPYNCAGSFKSEQLGISLVESMEGTDPSALVGLPLIKLAAMLRLEGVLIP
jgi:septum formation protein